MASGPRARRGAFANDLLWGLALVTAIAVMVLTGHHSAGWLMLAWGASATVAAVAGAVQSRLAPGVSQAAWWLLERRDLVAGSFRESLGLGGASRFRLYGLAALAGLAAAGSLRAAELLLSPLTIAIMVLRWPSRSRRGVAPVAGAPRSSGLFVAVAGAAGALLWGLALLLLPDSLGGGAARLVLAARLPAHPAGVPGRGRYSCSAGAWIGMRPFGAVRRGLRAQGSGRCCTCPVRWPAPPSAAPPARPGARRREP